MRKNELEIGAEYLTRWGIVAKLKVVTQYRIYLYNGNKKIVAHWSDLIRKYNGGNKNGSRN